MLRWIFCLLILAPTTVLADSSHGSKKWLVDLGGKTANIVGLDKPLTGVRAGVVLPRNINIAAEAFTLTEPLTSQHGDNYRKQVSYNYFGVHAEYSYKLSVRWSVLSGLSAGVGIGTFEEKNGDVVSSTDKTYASAEPSLSLSARVVKSMWLNVGASYFLVGNKPGFKNSASLNLFARYMW